jgi:hypothetical protein
LNAGHIDLPAIMAGNVIAFNSTHNPFTFVASAAVACKGTSLCRRQPVHAAAQELVSDYTPIAGPEILLCFRPARFVSWYLMQQDLVVAIKPPKE